MSSSTSFPSVDCSLLCPMRPRLMLHFWVSTKRIMLPSVPSFILSRVSTCVTVLYVFNSQDRTGSCPYLLTEMFFLRCLPIFLRTPTGESLRFSDKRTIPWPLTLGVGPPLYRGDLGSMDSYRTSWLPNEKKTYTKVIKDDQTFFKRSLKDFKWSFCDEGETVPE